MFRKILLGFAIVAASVRASRGNYSALNTSDTFDHQNGTQPAAFNVPDGLEEELISRRLNSDTILIQTYEDGTTLRALWLHSSDKEFTPTVLMLNDKTSGTTVEEYEEQLKEYEQQADDVRNRFNVNVLMVYYRGYVTYMKKKYREIKNDS